MLFRSVPSGYLANLEIKSTLEDEIKAAQQHDADILEIKVRRQDAAAQAERQEALRFAKETRDSVKRARWQLGTVEQAGWDCLL